jgi:hypothetical protein
MNWLSRSAVYMAIASATSTQAFSKCYEFGVWSKETYCYPDPVQQVWIDPAPERLDLPFIDVLRAIEPITNTASEYLAMPAPNNVEELDRRVSDFFLTAHRESDYLAQGVERLDIMITNLDNGIAEATSFIEANRSTAELLTAERDRLHVELNARVAEREKWQARVAQLRDGAFYFSRDASYAKESIIDLITAVAPTDSLLITPEKLASAESVWRQFPALPDLGPICCDPAPPVVDPAEPDWRPRDRMLAVDLSAPRDVKISTLWQLSETMRQNSALLDSLAAEKAARLAQFTPLHDRKNSLDMQFFVLRGQITTLQNDHAKAGEDVSNAERDSQDARDKMVLSALQEWVWRSARDEVIIPEIRAFLTTNGFHQVAEKLSSVTVWETIQVMRNATWSDALGIRGLDEFKAVQEKTLQLLNPTQSLILQSAEINAWATPSESEKFTRSVFERLGNDTTEYFKAAGQVNVDEQYQSLLQNLLGGMEGNQSSGE